MAQKKVPLGKAIKVDAALDEKEIAAIKAQWQKDAPPELRKLLDASIR